MFFLGGTLVTGARSLSWGYLTPGEIPHSWMRVPQDGVPPVQGWGTPMARSGWGGTLGWGTPIQAWVPPCPGQDGGTQYGVHTPSPPARDGVPLARSGWGVPGMRYHPLPLARHGVPPGIGQHMEYLIRGRWYASCVHAGGLSCYINFSVTAVIHIKVDSTKQLPVTYLGNHNDAYVLQNAMNTKKFMKKSGVCVPFKSQ